MSVIIRLQGLSWSASAMDIRNFFQGLSIPPGGVHIIGGENGDAFIAFTTDEDARQAMMLTNKVLNDTPVQLFLSSKTEMQSTISKAKEGNTPAVPVAQVPVQQPQVTSQQSQNIFGLPAFSSIQLQQIAQSIGLTPADLNKKLQQRGALQQLQQPQVEQPLPGEYSVGGMQEQKLVQNNNQPYLNQGMPGQMFPPSQQPLFPGANQPVVSGNISNNNSTPTWSNVLSTHNVPSSIIQAVANLQQNDNDIAKNISQLQNHIKLNSQGEINVDSDNRNDTGSFPGINVSFRPPGVMNNQEPPRLAVQSADMHFPAVRQHGSFPGQDRPRFTDRFDNQMPLMRPPGMVNNQDRQKLPETSAQNQTPIFRPQGIFNSQNQNIQQFGDRPLVRHSGMFNNQDSVSPFRPPLDASVFPRFPLHGQPGPFANLPPPILRFPAPVNTAIRPPLLGNEPVPKENTTPVVRSDDEKLPHPYPGPQTSAESDQAKTPENSINEDIIAEKYNSNATPNQSSDRIIGGTEAERRRDARDSRSGRDRDRDRDRSRDDRVRDRSRHHDSPRSDRDRRNRDRDRTRGERDETRGRRDRDKDRDRRDKKNERRRSRETSKDKDRKSNSPGLSRRSSRKRSLSPDNKNKHEKEKKLQTNKPQSAEENSSAPDKSPLSHSIALTLKQLEDAEQNPSQKSNNTSAIKSESQFGQVPVTVTTSNPSNKSRKDHMPGNGEPEKASNKTNIKIETSDKHAYKEPYNKDNSKRHIQPEMQTGGLRGNFTNIERDRRNFRASDRSEISRDRIEGRQINHSNERNSDFKSLDRPDQRAQHQRDFRSEGDDNTFSGPDHPGILGLKDPNFPDSIGARDRVDIRGSSGIEFSRFDGPGRDRMNPDFRGHEEIQNVRGHNPDLHPDAMGLGGRPHFNGPPRDNSDFKKLENPNFGGPCDNIGPSDRDTYRGPPSGERGYRGPTDHHGFSAPGFRLDIKGPSHQNFHANLNTFESRLGHADFRGPPDGQNFRDQDRRDIRGRGGQERPEFSRLDDFRGPGDFNDIKGPVGSNFRDPEVYPNNRDKPPFEERRQGPDAWGMGGPNDLQNRVFPGHPPVPNFPGPRGPIGPLLRFPPPGPRQQEILRPPYMRDVRAQAPRPSFANMSDHSSQNVKLALSEPPKSNTDDAKEKTVDASTLIMEGLPLDTSYKDVRKFFNGKEIPRDGIKIINDKKGNRIGVVYVKFTSNNSLQQATALKYTKFKSKSVTIRPVSQKEFDEAIDSFVPDECDDGSSKKDLHNTLGATLSLLKGEDEIKQTKGKILEEKIVRLEKLPNDATNYQMKELFKECSISKKSDGITFQKDQKGCRTGVCYIEFADNESFQKALNHRSVFRNAPISIFSVSKKERDDLISNHSTLESKSKEQDSTAKKADVPSEKVDLAPKKEDIDPKKVDIAPEKVDVTANKVNDLPKKVDEAPKQVDALPKKVDAAPKHVDVAPKQDDAVTKKVDSVPTTVDSVPQKVDVVPKAVNIASNKTSDLRCIRIRNIPVNFTLFNVRHFLAGFDIVHRGITVCHDAIGRPVGECYVEFASIDEVDKAMRKDGVYIGRNRIHIQPVTRDKMRENLRDLKLALQPEKPTQPAVFFFVKATNLPKGVSTGELINFFSGFNASPESIRLNVGDATDKRDASTALIGFKQRHDAERAVEQKQGHMIRDRPIDLTKVILGAS